MRRFRTLKVPEHAHPLVVFMTKEQNRQQIGDHDLAEKVGVAPETLKQWRSRRSPLVHNIQAALNALGYELVVKPCARR